MQLGLDQIIRGKTSLILIHTVILFAIKHNKDEFLEKFRTLLSDFSQSLTPDEQKTLTTEFDQALKTDAENSADDLIRNSSPEQLDAAANLLKSTP